MNELNPEMTRQVHDLARLIGRKLQRENFDLQEQAQPLVQSLVRGGYSRMSDVNLQVRLEARVLDEFAEVVIHRRREMSAMAGDLQQSYEDLVKWETNQPNPPGPPKAANLSSFTES
jgi:hypothetical protein